MAVMITSTNLLLIWQSIYLQAITILQRFSYIIIEQQENQESEKVI